MQLWNYIASKTNSVGRLLLIAGLGGVLVAAMALPVVAASGILVRNTADKFTTLSVDSSSLPQRSAIYDSSGHLLTYVYGVDLGKGKKYTGIDRQPVDYSQISQAMLVAIVAIEDDRFWQHGALDVKGTMRALVNDLEHKPIQGGSTLEQQYVKNVLILQSLDDPAAQQAAAADTMSRKIDQLRMAVQVAHTMTKQEILAGYLNDSFYDRDAWGIEAAAETYFNTTAAKLTMVQAATLAGIVENPAQYDPITNPISALERRNTVLARIAQTDPQALTPAEAATLEQQPAGAARRHRGERVHGEQRRERRLLLRLRDALAAARPAARLHRRGPRQAARHRRAQGLHHREREGPGGGDQGGQLRAARELQDVQPGAQRRQ